MPSTSPYQQNDYQATSVYQPYRLPVNDIMKANMALNSFWDEGAQRVKSVYDNALGLNLITDENTAIRDNFIKESEKQITKLSSMDLSDPGVQRQGLNIFKPLFDDQNIVGENYVVKNLNKELAIGESFRTKDGGKEYNPFSVENIQYEKNFLNKDLNKRNGWKSLYNNMSKYTPQIDTSAEINKIENTVKANDIKEAHLAGQDWYIETIEKKDVSKERLHQAIEDMGSPALKEQMSVEGRNAYYKHLSSDPAGVDGYFQGVATNLLNSKITDLKNNKAEIDYENWRTPKKDNAEKKKLLQTNSDMIQKTIDDIELNQKSKMLGQFQNLNNIDNLSSNVSKIEQLWQSSSINNLASNLKNESIIHDLKTNTAKGIQENINVAKQRLNFDYIKEAEVKRSNLEKERNDRDKTSIDLHNAKGDGSSEFNQSGNTPYPTPNVSNQSPSEIDAANIEARNKFLNKDEEPLRQSVISNVLSESAWTVIQQHIPDGTNVGTVLQSYDVDAAAAFFKAYGDKYQGKAMVPGLNIPIPKGLTIDQYKSYISNMDVSTFKQSMGAMVKYDTKLASDLIGKSDDGPRKLAEFRATLNKSKTREDNITTNVFKAQVPALGNYAKYFDNGGKTALTDDNINLAYERYARDSNKPISVITINNNIKSDNYGKIQSSRETTPEEIKLYKSGIKQLPNGEHLISNIKSKEVFFSDVRNATDPVFRSMVNNNNALQSTFSFENDKNREVNFQRLRSIMQQAGSDKNPGIENILNFVEAHVKNASYNRSTPIGEETMPTTQFIMNGLSDKDQVVWDHLKHNIRIPTITEDKKWFQKSSSSGEFRNYGDKMITADFHNDISGQATINIINNSSSPNEVIPIIRIEGGNIFKRIKNAEGKSIKLEITNTNIEKMLLSEYRGVYSNLSEILSQDLDGANLRISAYLNNLEEANRNFENQNKKK